MSHIIEQIIVQEINKNDFHTPFFNACSRALLFLSFSAIITFIKHSLKDKK